MSNIITAFNAWNHYQDEWPVTVQVISLGFHTELTLSLQKYFKTSTETC